MNTTQRCHCCVSKARLTAPSRNPLGSRVTVLSQASLVLDSSYCVSPNRKSYFYTNVFLNIASISRRYSPTLCCYWHRKIKIFELSIRISLRKRNHIKKCFGMSLSDQTVLVKLNILGLKISWHCPYYNIWFL